MAKELMMMKLSTNRKIGVFSQSNYGKTYLVKSLIEFICRSGGRVVVYDTDHMDSRFKFSSVKGCKVFKPATGRECDPKYLDWFLTQMKAKYSDFYVFIDDLDSFFDEHSSLGFDFGELKSLASKGRHQRIGLIYATKMCSFLPTQIIQNTNLFYIGSFPTAKSIKQIDKVVSMDDILKLNYASHEFIEIDAENNYTKRIVIA